MREKAELYRRDVSFREGVRDASRIWGARWLDVLHSSTLILVKPDGLVAGVTPTVCDFLKREGFILLGASFASLADQVWRTMWRFQLTAASTDRFLVNDLLYQYPSLILALRDSRAAQVPAAVRLAQLKGTPDLSRQAPDTIRALIRQPHRLLTYVHVPDEPADVLRELAIVAMGGKRIQLLRAWRRETMSSSDGAALTEALGTGAAPRSFALSSALERLRSHLAERSVTGDVGERLQQALTAVASGARIDWQSFLDLLEDGGVALDPWDLVTFGVYAIELEDPGERKQIVTPCFADWDASSD
jgi:hypothetical protein